MKLCSIKMTNDQGNSIPWQENPWKSITLQNEHLKQLCLIPLSLSNASDYICRYFHLFIRKIGKYGNSFFENLKICFFSEIALKLSKSPYFFNIFGNFSFLNQTLGLRKSFLIQTTYVLKYRL